MTRFLVLCVCFVDRCLSLYYLSANCLNIFQLFVGYLKLKTDIKLDVKIKISVYNLSVACKPFSFCLLVFTSCPSSPLSHRLLKSATTFQSSCIAPPPTFKSYQNSNPRAPTHTFRSTIYYALYRCLKTSRWLCFVPVARAVEVRINNTIMNQITSLYGDILYYK